MDVERPGGEELIELLGGASIILCNSTYCRRVLGLVLVEEEGGGAGGVEEEEEEREIVANLDTAINVQRRSVEGQVTMVVVVWRVDR